MKLKRAAKWTGIIAAGLVAVLGVLLVIVLLTTAGGRFVVSIVNRSQDTVHIDRMDGRLAGHFELHDVTVSTGAVAVHTERASVDWRPGALISRRVHVTRLEVQGTRVTIAATGADTIATSTTAAPGDTASTIALPVDVVVEDIDVSDISLDAPEGVRVRRGVVTGAFKDERYDVSVGADVFAPVADSVRVDLHAEGGLGDANIDSLSIAVWQGTVGIRGNAMWMPRVAFTGQVDVDTVRAPGLRQPVTAHLEIGADARDRTVDADTLYATAGSASLRASAELDSIVTMTLDLDVPDIAAHTDSSLALMGGAHLSGSVQGTLRQFRTRVEFTAQDIVRGGTSLGNATALLDVTFFADSTYVPTRAELHSLSGRTRGASLDASGDLRWLPDIAWDLSLVTENVSFSHALTDTNQWTGMLSIDARSAGTLEEDGPHAMIDIERIDGVVNGQPLSGRVEGSVDGHRVDARALDITWGPVVVKGGGTVNEVIDITLEVDAPDISAVVPNAAGALELSVHASGKPDAPALEASVSGSGLAYGETSVQSLDGIIDANFGSDTGGVKADIRAGRIAAGGHLIDTLTVAAAGNRPRHEIEIFGTSADIALTLGVAGGVADSTWSGDITKLEVTTDDVGQWTNEAPAPVSVTRTHASLDSLCLASQTSRLCVAGAWAQNDSIRADVVLDHFDLVALKPFLSDSLSVSGEVTGDVTATVRDSLLEARARFDLGPGKLTYQMDGIAETLEFAGDVTATAGSDGVATALNLEVTGRGGKATATGALDIQGYQVLATRHAEHPVEATLDLDLPDVSFVEAFIPAFEDVHGRFAANASAQGTTRDLQLTTTMDLADASVRVPAAGISIRDITLRAEGERGGHVRLQGGASSGGGKLEVDGTFTSSRGKWMSAEVSVTGDRFMVLNTPEKRVLISPKLTATVDTSSVNLSGDLVLPVARIRMVEVPPSAVSSSRDVVYVGTVESGRGPLDVNADVRLVLGDSVSFRGYGFSGDLVGSIRATQRPGKPARGTGELNVRNGTYRVSSTVLTVDPGRVIFAGGPIDNPGVDIRAYRITSDDVTVGVIIRGNVQRNTMTVFSDPAMSQSDALSYLLFGRKMSEGDPSQANMLTTVALSMGVAQSGGFTEGIGSSLGVDQATIESEGTLEEASFVAGKYLSPRLYLSYGVGLFDKQTTVRIRYMLFSRVTLQAESGRESSTDILYRIERGE